MFARISEIAPHGHWANLVHRHLEQVIDDIGLKDCQAQRDFGLVDLDESENAFVLTADVPGIKADEVDISLEQRRLTIRAERQVGPSEERRSVLQERHNIALSRTMILPKAIVADEISASVTDGILTIVMPKSADITPRKIPVN